VIDLQVNGAAGLDLTADPASLWEVGRALTRFGVTAFVPTLVSPSERVVAEAQAVLLSGPPHGYNGATPLGLHVEGPFISPVRAGAHPLASLRVPHPVDWAPETGVRMVTIAPELPGALDVIASLAGRGIVVSIGHTDATFEETRAGIEAGATYATHLFNGMAPLDHRAPGPIGALLADERVTIGLIVDGIHLHPAVVDLVWRAVGRDRVSVVTDAMAALGMPAGRYRLGAVDVDVDAEGAARLDGRLAGATVPLDAAVANLRKFTGASAADALATVTTVPRRLLRLDQ
jgi:N-acetylglucosamine-6-phosphate deacetylase